MSIIPDEELVALVGELLPGEMGFLPLDENGTPSGPATKVQTEDPSVYVRAGFTDQGESPLTTESGAPITDNMEPYHSVTYEFDETPPPPPVPPVLSAVLPATTVAASPDTPISVTGTGFVDGDTVLCSGSALATTFESDMALSATIPAASLAAAATLTITVQSTAGVSNSLDFDVTAASRMKAPPPRGSKTS